MKLTRCRTSGQWGFPNKDFWVSVPSRVTSCFRGPSSSGYQPANLDGKGGGYGTME